MIVTFMELVDLVVMIAAVGFIFKDFFKINRISHLGLPIVQKWDWEAIRMAIYATAPAIALHELGHKFVAVAFGYAAVFKAAYGFLAFGVILKLLKFPFIFFVPGYVQVQAGLATSDPIAAASIAIAGPLVNLLLWLIPKAILKNPNVNLKRKTKIILLVTSKINMFLFFLNMIPFGFFDGGHFFQAIGNLF